MHTSELPGLAQYSGGTVFVPGAGRRFLHEGNRHPNTSLRAILLLALAAPLPASPVDFAKAELRDAL